MPDSSSGGSGSCFEADAFYLSGKSVMKNAAVVLINLLHTYREKVASLAPVCGSYDAAEHEASLVKTMEALLGSER